MMARSFPPDKDEAVGAGATRELIVTSAAIRYIVITGLRTGDAVEPRDRLCAFEMPCSGSALEVIGGRDVVAISLAA